MSTFHVCDWCGEPVAKPVTLSAIGLLERIIVWDRDLAHYHQDERECYSEAMAALRAAADANQLADAPR